MFGTAGRATTATDNSPMGMVNTTVTLKPRDQWRPGMTFERLQAEMDEALQFPGFPNVWTQPIRSRLDMLFTGIKTPVGIKILGPDLAVIQDLGLQIEGVLQRRPGHAQRVRRTRGATATSRTCGIDRDAIARYGLTVKTSRTSFRRPSAASNVSRTVEGRERYPINVRYQHDFRGDLASARAGAGQDPGGRAGAAGPARARSRSPPGQR